jgi:hypothetical protein
LKAERTMNGILGPRSLGNMLAETFQIYGRNSLRLLAIVAIVEIILRFMWSIPDFSSLKPLLAEGKTAPLGHLIPVGIALLVASVMGLSLMQGALIHGVSEQYLRQPIRIGRAFRFAWERLASMAGAMMLAMFVVMGIVMVSIGFPVSSTSRTGYLFVTAGFCVSMYLLVCWSFILQAALLEGMGPVAAILRSRALVRNNWWRVLYMTIAVGFATVAISLIIGALPTIGPALGNILSTPVFTIGITLLYYDLRARKEEYNLGYLAEELRLSEPSDASGSNQS